MLMLMLMLQLSGRRLQNHGGMVHAKGLIPAPLPTWLQQLLARLPPQLLSLFPPEQPPNHVLINSYQPGCGIMVRVECVCVDTSRHYFFSSHTQC